MTIGIGRALVVGVRFCDAAAYGGRNFADGTEGAEFDVDHICQVLRPFNYEQTLVFKSAGATLSNVRRELDLAAIELRDERDVFVMYFSGHGGRDLDSNGDVIDASDAKLFLYDGLLYYHELAACFAAFRPGVRVVALFDSCNSGGVITPTSTLVRMPGPATGDARFNSFDELMKDVPAQIIMFAAAHDGEDAASFPGGGDFTFALMDAWNTFPRTYGALFDGIRFNVRGQAVPVLREYGGISDRFRNSIPFSVDLPLAHPPQLIA